MKLNKKRKIIVAVAPVGKEIEAPSVNPLLPEDVAGEVVACTKAGAGMVHLHVRDKKGEQTENLTDFSVLATAIGMGASFVRVGFEDSPFFAPGKAAKSNVELVERIVSLVHQIGYKVASCNEAREMLQIRKQK